jgi:hypothetical protein
MLPMLGNWLQRKRAGHSAAVAAVPVSRGGEERRRPGTRAGGGPEAGSGAGEVRDHADPHERPKILLVGTGDRFAQGTLVYATHLAARLDYDLVALNVGESWEFHLDAIPLEEARRAFQARARGSLRVLHELAAQQGVHCNHRVEFGDLETVVARVQGCLKRIEFVITDAEVAREDLATTTAVPVFHLSCNPTDEKGGNNMSQHTIIKREKPVVKTVLFGVLSVAMYAVVFADTGFVMKYFTRGGWYAALPIVTVFAFSFAHGSFANHLWSLLGIEARKQQVQRQTVEKAIRQRKRAHKKPRTYAYVNPWHRL